jgi:hypothetical protein
MTEHERIRKEMKQKIIDSKDRCYSSNAFYWLAQLDYSRTDSHVEHKVLEQKIDEDFQKIIDARYLIATYKKLGVDFKGLL